MVSKNKFSPVGSSWDDFETATYTPEEIAASNLRVDLIIILQESPLWK